MKFLNNNKIKNNFLGFSHSSPNMEVPSTISTNLPNSAIFDGVLGRSNNEVFSHLSTMPLESDGSLCMMEGFSRSQAGLESSSTSSPKLEDFLGGSSMDTPVHYGSNDRETLASHQQIEFETSPTGSFNSFQQNPYFFSGLVGNEMYMTPLEETNRETHLQNFSLQLPPVSEYGFQSLRNWVGMKSPTDHSVEQRMAWFFGDGGRHDSLGAMSYGDLQSLNLSTGTESVAVATKKRGFGNVGKKESAHRKSIDTFGQRTSQYRGVTKHRWTGRFEAHLWDNSCKKEGQTRKGRQVYLGGYDMEEKAARAYDLAALKYWGTSTYINLSLEDYKEELEQMKNMNRQEYVAYLRRKSSGFSRGASIYRGVTRHHQHGRWQARIGRIAGSKDLYLGTFGTQEEAAEAYDIAAIKFRGVNAVTNFEITRYDVELIRESNVILNGELAKRNKPTNDRPVVNHPIGSLRDDNGIGGLNSSVVIDDDQNSLEKTIKINKLPNHKSVQEGVEVSVMTSLGGSRKNPLSQGLLPQ